MLLFDCQGRKQTGMEVENTRQQKEFADLLSLTVVGTTTLFIANFRYHHHHHHHHHRRRHRRQDCDETE